MTIKESIYELFKEYFGEDNVDFQNDSNILIHWPTVTVANEFDESIVIWDLYAKISIRASGSLIDVPYFRRTSFNKAQWNSRYVHSHLPRLHGTSDIDQWNHHCCLGTGPIRQTIHRLQTDGSDLDLWNLFIFELDKYVHVESLNGGPYIRMSTVSSSGETSPIKNIHYLNNINTYYPYLSVAVKNLIDKYIKYLCSSKILKFNYNQGAFTLGYSVKDTILILSDLCIQWANTVLNEEERLVINNQALVSATLVNNILSLNSSRESINTLSSLVGRRLFRFKDREIVLEEKDPIVETISGELLILQSPIIGYIVYKILRFINVYYGKSIDTKIRII